MKPQDNPWAYQTFEGRWVQTCSAADRLVVVRETTDPDRLRTIITWPHTQKTVRQAAERRLRKLTD